MNTGQLGVVSMCKSKLKQNWLSEKDALSNKKTPSMLYFKTSEILRFPSCLMSFALMIFMLPLLYSCVQNNSSLTEEAAVEFVDTKLETAVREELDILDGDITGKDMLSLTAFEAQSSRIECLDGLEDAAKLKRLWLNSNAITDISPLAGLTELEVLWLNKNDITDITPLERLNKLSMIKLGFNNITDISPLAGLTEIEKLWLTKNGITDITPLERLNELRLLQLGSNSITDLSPLYGLTNLRSLYLYSNEITDISPLAELNNLRSLWLGSNNITDISPLAELVNLKRLMVESNLITDISPLIKNEGTTLEVLHINSNPLSSAAYSEHIPKLENRGLRIRYDKPGGIHGTVFHSQNGEGVEGITVFLDVDQDGEHDSREMSTTTNSDGTYSFAPIGPYDYQVRIIPEDEWSVESPADGYHPVSLPEAEEIKEKDFVLTRE